MRLLCPAKVNLFLAIRGKGASGYHEVETVLARVPELADELIVEPAQHFEFHCTTLPAEGNSVVKAVQRLQQKTGRTFACKVTLQKNIPPQSGLGGGASDAAAILLYLNEVEKLGFTREELMELGVQIGMDVPFFLSGYSVALGTHYGEKITPLQDLPSDFKIAIETTGKAMSTPEAYQRWDATPLPPAPSSAAFLAALQEGQTPELLAKLYNDFERILPELGPYSPTRHLCGSGGAIFIASCIK